MEHLRQRDFRVLLEFLRGLYTPRDAEDFVREILSTLPDLISSEVTSYDEMIPAQKKSKDWVNPPEVGTPQQSQLWQEVMHEHPVLTHYLKTGDGRPRKISDFLSSRQFQQTGLYREHFRPMNVRYLLGTLLPTPPPLAVAVGLHRDLKDFSERERLILDLVRSHLIQAWHNAKAVSRMQQELELVKGIVEALDEGIVVLTRDGSMLSTNSRARQWLEDYFGDRSLLADRLPENLVRWVKREERLSEQKDSVPSPRKPLVVEKNGRRLIVRHLCQEAQCLLLLDEHQTTSQPAALEPLGVTRREADVLHWVAYGKTNNEIGAILGLSPRTVQKHLERIYQKLGVENRTAAAAKAYETLRLSGKRLLALACLWVQELMQLTDCLLDTFLG